MVCALVVILSFSTVLQQSRDLYKTPEADFNRTSPAGRRWISSQLGHRYYEHLISVLQMSWLVMI